MTVNNSYLDYVRHNFKTIEDILLFLNKHLSDILGRTVKVQIGERTATDFEYIYLTHESIAKYLMNTDDFKDAGIRLLSDALHELGHWLFTDKDAWDNATKRFNSNPLKSQLFSYLVNALEDGRMESHTMNEYYGTIYLFMYSNSIIFKEKNVDNLSDLDILMLNILSISVNYRLRITDIPSTIKEVHDDIISYIQSQNIWKLPTTDSIVEVSEVILNKIMDFIEKNPQQNTQQQSQNGQSQQGDNGQQSQDGQGQNQQGDNGQQSQDGQGQSQQGDNGQQSQSGQGQNQQGDSGQQSQNGQGQNQQGDSGQQSQNGQSQSQQGNSGQQSQSGQGQNQQGNSGQQSQSGQGQNQQGDSGQQSQSGQGQNQQGDSGQQSQSGQGQNQQGNSSQQSQSGQNGIPSQPINFDALKENMRHFHDKSPGRQKGFQETHSSDHFVNFSKFHEKIDINLDDIKIEELEQIAEEHLTKEKKYTYSKDAPTSSEFSTVEENSFSEIIPNLKLLPNKYSSHKGIGIRILEPKVNLLHSEIYEKNKFDIETDIEELVYLIKMTLKRKTGNESESLYSGLIDSYKLQNLILDNLDIFRMFDDKTNQFKDSIFIGVDLSGSMSSRLKYVIRSLILLHEVLKQVGIKHAIFGFNTSGRDTCHYPIISFDDWNNDESSHKIASLQTNGANRDGLSIRVFHEYIKKSGTTPLYITITDGNPHHVNYSGEPAIEDTKLALDEMGLPTIAICIGDKENMNIQSIYDNSIECEEVYQLPSLLHEFLMETMT